MSSSETLPAQENKSLLGVGTIPKGEQRFVQSSESNSVQRGPPIPIKNPLKLYRAVAYPGGGGGRWEQAPPPEHNI